MLGEPLRIVGRWQFRATIWLGLSWSGFALGHKCAPPNSVTCAFRRSAAVAVGRDQSRRLPLGAALVPLLSMITRAIQSGDDTVGRWQVLATIWHGMLCRSEASKCGRLRKLEPAQKNKTLVCARLPHGARSYTGISFESCSEAPIVPVLEGIWTVVFERKSPPVPVSKRIT